MCLTLTRIVCIAKIPRLKKSSLTGYAELLNLYFLLLLLRKKYCDRANFRFCVIRGVGFEILLTKKSVFYKLINVWCVFGQFGSNN